MGGARFDVYGTFRTIIQKKYPGELWYTCEE